MNIDNSNQQNMQSAGIFLCKIKFHENYINRY